MLGGYRIIKRLGSGGMGQVYLGRSPHGQLAAIKVIHPELAEERDFRRRFAREVAAARRVSGRFTAAVLAADPEGSPPWMATEYIAGPSLAEAVTESGPFPESAMWPLALGLTEALAAIHRAGLVHRDLKPQNVLVAADGPKVIDFGIAQAAEASALTRTGVLVGSPGYMSPEQLTGASVGPSSDMFSLGALLAYAASGVPPFGSGPTPAMLFRIVHEDPDLVGLPTELAALVARCLAKDPAARPEPVALLAELTARQGNAATEVLDGTRWMHPALAASLLERAERPEAGWVTVADQQPQPLPTAAGTPSPSRRKVLKAAAVVTASAAGLGVLGWAVRSGGSRGTGPGSRSTARDPRLAWQVTLPTSGQSHDEDSQLVVMNGTLYVFRQGQDVHALDAAAGAQRWTAMPGGIPALADGKPLLSHGAFFVMSDGAVLALEAATGRRLWDLTPGQTQTSPIAADDKRVYSVYLGRVFAVDPVTGRQIWSFQLPEGEFPDVLVASGGLLYAVAPLGGNKTPGGLRVFDGATGRRVWARDRIPATSTTEFSLGTIADGTVYLNPGDDHLYAVDAKTGAARWNTAMPDSSSSVNGGYRVVSADHRLYLIGGHSVTAVDPATGSTKWTVTGISDSGSVHISGGSVYLTDSHSYSDSSYGEAVNLYAADARTGVKRWMFDVASGQGSTVLTDGTTVYVNGPNCVQALDAASGKPTTTYAVPDIQDHQAKIGDISGGMFYTLTQDQVIRAYRIAPGPVRTPGPKPPGLSGISGGSPDFPTG